MSSSSQESARMCRDCGRPAPQSGNACPACGGPLMAAPPRMAPPLEKRRHPQILAAAATFCAGLVLMPVVLRLVGNLPSGSGGRGDPLMLLMLVSVASTVGFLILRLEEGDFRALFVLLGVQFLTSELFGFLGQNYGIQRFQDLGTVLAFAVVIFGSLCVTASMYDGPDAAKLPFRRAMIWSAVAMLAVGGLHALREALHGKDPSLGKYMQIFDIAGTVLIAAAISYLTFVLFRSVREEREASRERVRHKRVPVRDMPPTAEALPVSPAPAPAPGPAAAESPVNPEAP